MFGYSPTNKSRVNPQFMGIAEKYSAHKKKRLLSDRERNNVLSNYKYMLKLNLEMDRNLEDKQSELLHLKEVRERHNNDIKNKYQENQRKRKRLQELREKSAEQRNSLKNGLRTAYSSLQSQRNHSKAIMKERLHEYEQELKKKREMQHEENQMRHNMVETDKKIGNEKINRFHRQKNKMSLNNYKKMMKQEDSLSERNQSEIERMKGQIKKYKGTVKKKQKKLKNVLQEMSLYSVEVYSERTPKKLTGELFRISKTSSSLRSKPSQILMKSCSNKKKSLF